MNLQKIGMAPSHDRGSAGSDPDRLLARAAALAGAGAWSCDLSDDRLCWTAGTYDLFGFPRDRPVARQDAVALYAEESRLAMEHLRAEAIALGQPFTLDARIVRADGTERWIRLTADVVSEGGRVVQLYGLKQDITGERARWDALRRLADQDSLTGLAGHRVFQSRFLDGDPAQMPLGAVVLFDIDGFKQVNDRHGHAAGDACLQEVAQRLQAGFRDALMVARIGGDEFAVLTRPGEHGALLAQRVAARLETLSRPIPWRGGLLWVSASAGIAAPADPGRYDPEPLFAAADAALYSAKRAGRNRVRQAPGEQPGVIPFPGGAQVDRVR